MSENDSALIIEKLDKHFGCPLGYEFYVSSLGTMERVRKESNLKRRKQANLDQHLDQHLHDNAHPVIEL